MPTEPYLASPSATREILQRYGFHTQKKYGQNFLIDPHVPEKIMQAAEICPEDAILEIGPGIGTLTQFLASRSRSVLAVEVDRQLLPILTETLSDFPQAEVLSADILKVDLQALLTPLAEHGPVKVVANLPYYITTPILMTMLEAKLPVVSYTLMVQKEVADRMLAGPGSKDYGALSLAVQYYTEPKIAMQVSPNCFLPRPTVGSSVVQLRTRGASGSMTDIREEEQIGHCGEPVSQERQFQEEVLFAVIKAAFGQRRKTLVNALTGSTALSYSKEQIEAALAICGFRPDIRGEALSLDDFKRLTKALSQHYSTLAGIACREQNI